MGRPRGRPRKYHTEEERREAQREYNRRYYEANREAGREYARRYHAANLEARREYDRRYYEANREARREYDRRYYEANRDAKLEFARRHYREKLINKGRVLARYKQLAGCAACCWTGDPNGLAFHHVEPKRGLIKPSRRWSWILDELDRCVVLCQRCHSRLHGTDGAFEGVPALYYLDGEFVELTPEQARARALLDDGPDLDPEDLAEPDPPEKTCPAA